VGQGGGSTIQTGDKLDQWHSDVMFLATILTKLRTYSNQKVEKPIFASGEAENILKKSHLHQTENQAQIARDGGCQIVVARRLKTTSSIEHF